MNKAVTVAHFVVSRYWHLVLFKCFDKVASIVCNNVSNFTMKVTIVNDISVTTAF